MEIGCQTEGTTGILKIGKFLDVSVIGQFKDGFRHMMDDGAENFILDFSDTEFMDSSGVGAIILLSTAMKHKGQIILVYSRTPMLRMFLVSGLNNIVTVCATMADARNILRQTN